MAAIITVRPWRQDTLRDPLPETGPCEHRPYKNECMELSFGF